MIRGRNKYLKSITPEISLRSTYTNFYLYPQQPDLSSSRKPFRNVQRSRVRSLFRAVGEYEQRSFYKPRILIWWPVGTSSTD
jgi:hypothetical protein